MKAEKNILFAFILNLAFSLFEFFGGIFTGSVAIVSDAVHDLGDAASIGTAFLFEKKSKKQPDKQYSYGYARYSVLGSAITTFILLIGSILVIYNAVKKIITPTEIHFERMIIFAVFGVLVNLIAALLTRKGESLNQKAVNLHMLEDVLGWLVVLIGAIVMLFTDFYILDPIMSIAVATFILIPTLKNLRETIDIFLEKTPRGLCLDKLKEQLETIDGVLNAHHLHVWSLDGQKHYATVHIVTTANPHEIKHHVRDELKKYGIIHTTIELECEGEHCHEPFCQVEFSPENPRHHHHH